MTDCTCRSGDHSPGECPHCHEQYLNQHFEMLRRISETRRNRARLAALVYEALAERPYLQAKFKEYFL